MDELMEKWHDQFGLEEDEKSALVSHQGTVVQSNISLIISLVLVMHI